MGGQAIRKTDVHAAVCMCMLVHMGVCVPLL